MFKKYNSHKPNKIPFKDYFQRRTVYIFNAIDGKRSLGEIAKKSGSTYVTTMLSSYEFEKAKLVIKEKEGRDIKISLTKKGKFVQNHLLQIQQYLK